MKPPREPRGAVRRRLDRLGDGPAPPAAAVRRRPPPLVWIVLAGLLLTVAGLYRAAAAPPPAIDVVRAAVPVRLLAVTRQAPHQYAYQPPRTLARRIFPGAGDTAVTAAPSLPADAVCLWLWVGAPNVAAPASPRVVDDAQRAYVNDGPYRALESGSQPWGRATLVWVALTNFDRTARRLRYSLNLPGVGAAEFAVDWEARAPAAWPLPEVYPATAGDEQATIRLWHLRRVDPLAMADLLEADGIDPAADLMVADFDVVEKAGAEPGVWKIDVTRAETDHGEAPRILAQRAGLVYLATGRRLDEVRSVRFEVEATKLRAGTTPLVFGGLELPEPGQQATHARGPSKPAPIRLTCQRSARLEPKLARFTIEGEGTGGAIAQLEFTGGLDDRGLPVVASAEEDGVTLVDQRRAGGRDTWRWSLLCEVRPEARAVALGFRLTWRAPSLSTEAALTARLLPRRAPEQLAALGLLLKPAPLEGRAAPDSTTPFAVAQVIAGTQAAASGLKPGDLILAVDELPPAMLARALLRHDPGQRVGVLFRRGGKLYRTGVILDAAHPPAEEPAAADRSVAPGGGTRDEP